MKDSLDIDGRQIFLIKAIRFPLIVLVLFQHSVGYDLSPMHWECEGKNIYHFLTELVSHHICSIAVPCFFMLSGFLFFYKQEGIQRFGLWVVGKWKRRFHTLLIPYLLWNLLNVVVILLVMKVFLLLNIHGSSNQMDVVQKGPLYWFIAGPIDFPLWYLRDLIVLSLLAPILYLGTYIPVD